MLGSCAGKLNRYIELQTSSPSQDAGGEYIDSWSTLANVWAEKLSSKASEKYTGEQFQGYRTIVWRIRYRTDVNNLARVVWESNNYDVLGVTEEGYKQDLIIITEAIL